MEKENNVKMLYGNVIFIKKSGVDGSKFPVTSTNVCIGRSDDCIIRIQNPLISPKHCQLMIASDGQAKIKNLSSTNPTVLNDQPLGNGKHALCQGDILKFGDRFARWEYLPSSKYYPMARGSGPLVAVVANSPRDSEKSEAETPQLFGDSSKKQNKRFSATERGSVGKSLRMTPGSAKAVSSRRQLVLRHSLQLKKLGLSPQVTLRSSLVERSVSGTPKRASANTTPVRKSQKWEVKSVSPPNKVKNTVKNGINRKSTPIKMPMAQMSSENAIKSGLKNASKAPNLLTIEELPLPNVNRILSERTIDDIPKNNNLSLSPKTPYKTGKTPNKVKINSENKSLPKSSQKRAHSRALKDLQSSFSCEENMENANHSMKFSPSEGYNLKRLSVRRSVLKNDTDSSGQVLPKDPGSEKLPGTRVKKRKSSFLHGSNISSEGKSDVEAEKNIPPKIIKSSPATPSRGKSQGYSKNSPVTTPRKVEGLSRGKKSIPSGVLDTPVGKENVKTSPRKKAVSSSKKPAVNSAQKEPKKRGVKRKLSAIASAERAAKKLKTIAPTKPDKNKKAALLVLGKASGKLKLTQNSNIVIKKKIVKKAIKQFTTNREKTAIAKVKKTKKAKSENASNVAGVEEKSTDLSPVTLTKRHSTPIKKSPLQVPTRSSARKSAVSDDVFKSESPTSLQRNKKSISSISSVSASDSMEVLHGSVPSKHSGKKSVSFSSTNSSIEYDSPNLQFYAKHSISKRLRSHSGDSSTEFTELSPFALGLTPKRMDDCKFQRQKGRRSYCVGTPENKVPVSIMKSASTSKINRKVVAFSDTGSNNSYLNLTSDAIFDLNEIQTPDVTIDLFVSPLSHKATPKIRSWSSVFKNYKEDILLGKEENRSLEQSPDCIKPDKDVVHEEKSTGRRKSPRTLNLVPAVKVSRPRKSPKNDLTDVRGVRELMKTPGRRKSPKNDLTDVGGVRKLMETPGRRKSPKNDLTDVGGVRRLMESAGRRKSPRNDLTDVKGVRKLMESPGRRKSPKNDLTDVGGVKQLFEPPKKQKSPKNDLTDVGGVKQLFEPPKKQKSPKNDLTDVRGVRKLMETPGRRKSPKNDLTDVRGVRNLMESAGRRKSPKNDLTDVRGVRKLMESPGRRKSPKNDLTDVRGVRRLMESAGRRKSPKNDLTDVSGVRRLMTTPGRRTSPKNDLTDVRGVRKLFEPQEKQKSPKNDLTDLRGVRNLMKSPKQRKSPRNDLTDVTGVKQLLSRKSPRNNLSNVSGLDTLFKSPPDNTECLKSSRKPASKDAEEDHNLSGVSHLSSTNEMKSVNVDTNGVAELYVSLEKVKTPKRSTRNTKAISPAMSVERRVLRRAAKAAPKKVDGSDTVRTRRKANSSSEVPAEENPKVVKRGRKADVKDEIEKPVSRRTRAGSIRDEKVTEEIKKPQTDLIVEEVITSRRTRASSKLVATKRPATPCKSPTPPKRTRKGPAVPEKVEESSPQTPAVSNLRKKRVLKTAESTSKPVGATRKSTAKESVKVNKTTRSKETETVSEVSDAPQSSRSLRQRAKTKTVAKLPVSPVVTRQRKAKNPSPAKKESKLGPVKTRRKAK